jgi:hypothetical protein
MPALFFQGAKLAVTMAAGGVAGLDLSPLPAMIAGGVAGASLAGR